MLLMTSPNDPAFYLHHCNIDRLWAQWQSQPAGADYVPGDEVADAPEGSKLDDVMQPWGVPVSSALNHSQMGYAYDTEPQETHLMAAEAPVMKAPQWKYQPPMHRHIIPMPTMFTLSPEDKAAGGHDVGNG